MISVPSGVAHCLAPHPDGRRPRCRTEQCLHVGQVTSLAVSPTKMAAEARLALASVALTGRRTTVVLLGNGGQARIRTVITSV